MAIAKIYGLESGKLNFGHDIGRVGGNSDFLPVVITLKYISAQEIASEVNLVSSYACTKGRAHEGKNCKIHEKSNFDDIL